MNAPIDELYFEWLCQQVHRDRGHGVLFPYTVVSGVMQEIPFNYSVPNDDNREAEGRALRYEFIDKHLDREVFIPDSWENFLGSTATLFEVLIALAQRCDFQVELGVGEWFFIFLQNLKLDKFDDNDLALQHKAEIRRILNRFNNRKYSHNGAGSIFPVRHARADMRKRELWYQMSDYIIANDMIR